MRRIIWFISVLWLSGCAATVPDIDPIMEPIAEPAIERGPQADVLLPCEPGVDDGFGGTGCSR